jgi:hypothetical protein
MTGSSMKLWTGDDNSSSVGVSNAGATTTAAAEGGGATRVSLMVASIESSVVRGTTLDSSIASSMDF